MLKQLIADFGKERINSLTKYPSILTLHKAGERGRLTPDFTTLLTGETLYATEKIDGTNVRLICYGTDYLIGSREFLLHYVGDLFFDPASGIVESVKRLVTIPQTQHLTVIYGELYGGKITANSKWYGTDTVGFRVFDVAVFTDLSVLENDVDRISRWRESETEAGLAYGQPFLRRADMLAAFPQFTFAPLVAFDTSDLSHQGVLNSLRRALPTTNVALSDGATGRAEGVILRNENRSRIVKLRFDDYERTLRQ